MKLILNGMEDAVKAYLSRIGSRGGLARMASLSPEGRRKLASKAGKRSGKVRARRRRENKAGREAQAGRG